MKALASCRVLVTPTSFGKVDKRIRAELESSVGEIIYNPQKRPLTSSELAGLLPGCDGYIAGLDQIDRTALESADQLKVIARYGVGVDNVDLATARKRNIILCNTPGANTMSVAELTIGLILSLARHIPTASALTRQAEWPRLDGISLEGKYIGLLGFGAIGKQVARRLDNFDCHILAHDLYPDVEFATAYHVELTSLDNLIHQADFLSLHLPLTPETQGMVDANFIQQMKRGAYLINTARGELVDEAALAAGISMGQLRGAALDVFRKEPPGKDHPLLSLPQVIVTPHSGSHTDGAINRMGQAAIQDCLAVLSGYAPRHRAS